MPIKPGLLLLGGAGAVVLYSGIKGKGIGAAFRSVIAGQTPAKAAVSNLISGNTGGSSPGMPGGGLAGNVRVGQSERAYFSGVLQDLGAPVTRANLQAMYRWAKKEEPSFPAPTSWTWNPLNISNPFGGFQSYPSPQAGAHGTANFMLNNDYGAIVSSLRSGNGIQDSPAVAAELSAWSGGGYTSVNSGGG